MNALSGVGAILGESRAIRIVREQVLKFAPANISVLVVGPTGTGKELVAEALHAHSGRRGEFVPVNVCAVSESLFEATFFGHVTGAFTGAVRESKGLIAEADAGTLFLDEISGMSVPHQMAMLRTIETRRYRQVGSPRERTSTFRLVTATNEPLPDLVTSGRMRADFAHRVRAAQITLPALRDRIEDVPVLARRFADELAPVASRRIELDKSAIAVLQAYDWPGNVRELRHAIETAAAISDHPSIGAAEIRDVLDQVEVVGAIGTPDSRLRARLVTELHASGGNVSLVARRLGRHRATIYRQCRKLGITLGEEKEGAEIARQSSRSREAPIPLRPIQSFGSGPGGNA